MRVCKYQTFFLAVGFFLPLLRAEDPVPTQTAVPRVTVDGSASSTNLTEQAINWITSYDDARSEGKKTDRPIMLFVTMEDCRYCVKMQRNSFDDAGVKNEISDSFVPTKLYLDPESYLGKSLKITMFPTTMFIAPDGSILGYVRGYIPREAFHAEMLSAKSANDERLRIARLENDKTEQ